MPRVLIAEDERVTRTLLHRTVRETGCEVILASNGLRAWQILDDNPDVDLLIADVMMPELDGLGLIRKLRADARFRSLMVIITSARVGVREVSNLLDQGATSFLPKPIDAGFLREELARLGRRAETLAPAAKPAAASDVAFDREAALARLDGDAELLSELAETFLEEQASLLAAVVDALEQRDADGLRAAAHTLKGAVSNFAATPAVEAARRVEELGRAGDFDEAQSALEPLRAAVDALAAGLKQG